MRDYNKSHLNNLTSNVAINIFLLKLNILAIKLNKTFFLSFFFFFFLCKSVCVGYKTFRNCLFKCQSSKNYWIELAKFGGDTLKVCHSNFHG